MADDEEPEGTGGGDPGDGSADPPEQGDGGQEPEGDGGEGAGDGGDGTSAVKDPPKGKGKPAPAAGGDGGGGDPPDPITAGLTALGERLEGVVKEQGEGLRGEMAQLKRDVDNRIELAEARYGRGTGSGNGGAGGPGAATQPRQKAWWEKLFW